MIGKCLGLDITPDYITAVLVRHGFQGVELLDCAVAPLLGKDADDFSRTLGTVLADMDLAGGTACLCSLPASQVSFRHFRMPFTDTKKISQTAAYEMESLVPYPIDEAIVDFTVSERFDDSTTILAGSFRRGYLHSIIEVLGRFDLTPLIIDIQCVPIALYLFNKTDAPENFLLLDWAGNTLTMLISKKRRIGLIRSMALPSPDASSGQMNHLAFVRREIRNTIKAYHAESSPAPFDAILLNGPSFSDEFIASSISEGHQLPIIPLNLGERIFQHPPEAHGATRAFDPRSMNNALALAIRTTKRWRGFNYRIDEFKVNRPFLHYRREIQKVAVVMLVLLGLFAVDFGLEYFSLQKRYQAAEQLLVETFKKDFPEVTRVIDPIGQLRAKMKEIGATTGAAPTIASKGKSLDLLKEISTWLQPQVPIGVARMVIDQEAVQMAGTTDNFNTVNSIEKMLEKSSYFQDVTISSANLDKLGKVVHFELRMTRKH